MTREEAKKAQEEGKVTASLLLRLTDRVYDVSKNIMQDFSGNRFCDEVLETLEDEKQKNLFLDKIFEAIQDTFTLPEMKILDESEQNSGNYHLMFERLQGHFKSSMISNDSYNSDISYSLDADETYEILFREVVSTITPPSPDNKDKYFDWRKVRKNSDYDKIQENFKK